MTKRGPSSVVALLFAASACAPRSTVEASATIGASGGEVQVTSGRLKGARVVVPPGALRSPVEVTIAPGTPVELEGFQAVGPAVELGPAGTRFLKEVTVTVPFEGASLPAGRKGTDLVVLKRQATGEVSVATKALVDESGSTVTVTTDSFSTFQAAAPASPPDGLPPRVVSTSPADNDTGVSVAVPIKLFFSEVMDGTSLLGSAFTLRAGSSSPVKGTMDAFGATAIFSPTGLLAYQTRYTATVTTEAKDVAGNGLGGTAVFSFTTEAKPHLDGGSDAGRDGGQDGGRDGGPDAGPPDAGPADAGSPDAGFDSGAPDAGSPWSVLPVGVPIDVRAVWGAAASEVWFAGVGDGGILSWNGTALVAFPVGTFALYALAGSGADQVWAGGEGGVLEFWNGSSWLPQATVSVAVRGLCALSSTEAYWVGGGGAFGQWNGTSWTDQATGGGEEFRALWGVSGTDLWAVGLGGLVSRWNGAQWTSWDAGTGVDLHQVWGLASDDVWAVGGAGTVLRFNGTAWEVLPTGVADGLNAVWGRLGSSVWVVGDNGRVLRWTGSGWTDESRGVAQAFRGVWGFGVQEVWLGGDLGSVWHRL